MHTSSDGGFEGSVYHTHHTTAAIKKRRVHLIDIYMNSYMVTCAIDSL